ncbi:hypothetical protein HK100_009209 [Physocladia obscura]|uniref:AAA+ ATPase domain-containing protein n=1 Tax=Physocladia obscura TaxID=109957 RepID=A0AAD5XJE9_9FUNG|nr:hypothetical protein HK100_009209 [Physocladia obscura]
MFIQSSYRATLKSSEWFHKNENVFRNIFKTSEKLDSAIREYESYLKLVIKRDKMRSFCQWLITSSKYDDCAKNSAAILAELTDDFGFDEINDCLSLCQNTLGLSDLCLNAGLFYVASKSSLFRLVFFAQQEFDNLEQSIATASEFLASLMDVANLKTEVFRKLYETTKSAKLSLGDELQLVSDFTKRPVPERLESMFSFAEDLFALIDNGNGLIDFCSIFGVYENVAVDLQSLLEAETEDSKNEATFERLQKAKNSILGGLFRSHHFMMFEAFAKFGNQFYRFYTSQQRFDDRIHLLTGFAQGNDAQIRILNSIVAVKSLCTIAISKHVSFEKMMRELITIVPTEKDTVREVERLKSVDENMSQIKVMFAPGQGLSLSNAVSYMSSLVQTGVYKSTATRNRGHLSFWYRVRQADPLTEYASDGLNDLVLQIRVFVDQKQSERSHEIQTFLNFFNISHELHKLHVELEFDGHPDYICHNASVQREKILQLTLSEGLLKAEKTLSYCKNDLKNWKAICKDYHIGRVLLLSKNQYSTFLHSSIPFFLGKSDAIDSIIPFLRLVFPNSANIQFSQYAHSFKISKNFTANISLESQASNLNDLLRYVEKMSKNEGLSVSDSQPVVIPAYGFNETQIFYLLWQLNDYEFPSPPAVLHCFPETTWSELLLFMNRTSKCNTICANFFLVGVNMLSLEVRQSFSQALLDTPSKLLKKMPLFIIFLSKTGSSMFTFLNSDDSNSALEECATNIETLKQHGRKQIKAKLNFKKMEVIQGPHFSGKTFYINQQIQLLLKENPKTTVLRFSVNEDWTSGNFLEKVKNLKSSNSSVVVVFNVSAYSNLTAFEIFLRWFFLRSLVFHDESGIILEVPSELQWTLYIELSKISSESDHTVLDNLPSSDLFRTTRSPWVISLFYIDDHCRIVCNFLETWIASPFSSIGSISSICRKVSQLGINAKSLSDERCRKALDQCRKLIERKYQITMPSSHLFIKQFVEVLHKKFEWLILFSNFLLQQQDILLEFNPDFWISVFLAEAAIQSCAQPDLSKIASSTILSVCSPGFDGNFPTVSFLNFSPSPDVITSTHKIFQFAKREDTFQFTKREDAISSPARMRLEVASSIQMNDSCNVKQVMKSSKYIVTPDLCVKLLFLHARKISGNNLIFSGETGTGKTEILDFYSKLLARNFPDALLQAKIFLEETIIPNYSFIVKTAVKTYLKAVLENDFQRQDNMVHAIRILCEKQPINPPNELLDSHVQYPSLEFISNHFIEWIHIFLNKFSLIDVETDPILLKVKKSATETNCETFEEFQEILVAFFAAGVRKLFFTLNMHAGITANSFKEEIKNVSKIANEVASTGSTVIFFIDEFNTTTIMGIVKEVICDKTLDAEPLPENLFIVAAMNPFSYSEVKTNSNFTGIAIESSLLDSTGTMSADYIVRKQHESLNARIMQFGTFESIHESDFVRVALGSESVLEKLSKENRETFAELILEGQKAVKVQKMSRVKVSIRDINRAINLMVFFMNRASWRLLNFDSILKENATNDTLFHRALVMTLSLTYVLRLNSVAARTKFYHVIDNHMKSKFWLQSWNLLKSQEMANNIFMHVHKKANIPKAIAPTAAFIENFFVMVVCLEANLPLLVVGPAGCSKTLSISVVCDNMQGSRSGKYFAAFSNVIQFRYQCAGSSTDKQVQAIYQTAIDRQKTLQSYEGNDRCFVLLDEAGLPLEAEMPLKVLHYLTDKPIVGTIVLSNNILDAAKTNRCVVIQHTKISPSDLTTLVESTLVGSSSGNGLDICQSLSRNFNGIHPIQFRNLTNEFAKNLIEVDQRMLEFAEQSPNVIKPMLESVREVLDPAEDPNSISFRHILLLDPTTNNAAVTIFQELTGGTPLKVITVGDFALDRTDFARSEIVIDMKESMKNGDTVYLTKHIAEDGSIELFVNVAVGSLSRPCIVHPKFKIIVVVPLASIREVPLPFLDRFGKHSGFSLFQIS